MFFVLTDRARTSNTNRKVGQVNRGFALASAPDWQCTRTDSTDALKDLGSFKGCFARARDY